MNLIVPASIEDAREIVRRYKLENYAWGKFATSDGFADYLFVKGIEDTTPELAKQVETYIAQCNDAAAERWDNNFQLRDERDFYERALTEHTERRAALASLIRDVKLGELGTDVWSTVAELATSRAPERWFAVQSPLRLPVARFLRDFRKTRKNHDDSN